LVLVGFTIYFPWANKEGEKRIMMEMWQEKQQDLGLLCDIVDRVVASQGTKWEESEAYQDWFRDLVINSVTYIETTYYSTYAQAFDSSLKPITDVHPGVGGGQKHNPLNYNEFVHAVSSQEFGTVRCWYETPEAGQREIFMSFRWIPTDPEFNDRILVAIGISKYSLVQMANPYVQWGQVILIVTAFIFIMGSSLALCGLGYIYEKRALEPVNGRWRRQN